MYGTILTLAVIASCSDKSTNPPGIDRSIESKIEIGMWEELDPNGRVLQLICETEKIYLCYNWSLVYKQLHNLPDRIQIEFLGIHIPDICATALGPATACIEIGQLSSGTYPLFITVKEHVHGAWLQVTSAAYSVSYDGGKWITFSRSELRRVPSKSLWGRVWGLSGSLVQAYVDTLERYVEYPIDLSPGYYGHFTADSTGTIIWSPSYPNICAYIYRFEGSWTGLENILRYLATAYKDSLSFEMKGSEGQWLASWMLAQEP